MLRTLKDAYCDPRLFAGKVTTSGTNTVTKTIGSDDLATNTEAGAGLPILTLKQGYSRTPLFLAAPGTGATNGSYCDQAGASTNSVFTSRIANAGGTGIDAAMHYLALGYLSSDISLVKPQQVLCSKRRSRIVGGKVTTSATVATVAFGKSDFTVTRTAQGVYTVVYKRAFAQSPVVLPIVINGAAVRSPVVSLDTAAGCTITFADTTPTAQDCDFYLIVVGSDSRDEHGIAWDPIMNPQRLPRIVAGQITYSAGVPSVTVNAQSFSSITDNGTGDATLNLARPFRQECIVMATSRSGRVQVSVGSASAPRLLAMNAAGVATDPTSVDFILLGSDDVSEY